MRDTSSITARPNFKAFLSHAYEAEAINIEFFKMFDEVADVQFEVDIGLKNLNVTRLERRMRDCDAFVGLYPYPSDGGDKPSPEDALKASRYFRLEIELAARARLPSIIFFDSRFRPAIKRLSGFSEKIFQRSDLQPPLRDKFRIDVKTAFEAFCKKINAEILARATGITNNADGREVGLLVPRGKGGYSELAIQAINDVVALHGYDDLVDIGRQWPPIADASLFDRLDSLDWIITDVGRRTVATGLLGLIHSRFVPAVRMVQEEGPPEPRAWKRKIGIGSMFGGLDVGYRKDIIYWRQDVRSLRTELENRVQVALSLPREEEVIKNQKDALDYFRRASGKRQVFVSYSKDEFRMAEEIVSVLRSNFPTVFDYRDDNESLPPGSTWRERIKQKIEEAHFGVMLISDSYLKSGYCTWEMELFVDAAIARKNDVTLMPILLEGVRARDLPAGLERIQAVRADANIRPSELARRLIRGMEQAPNRSGSAG